MKRRRRRSETRRALSFEPPLASHQNRLYASKAIPSCSSSFSLPPFTSPTSLHPLRVKKRAPQNSRNKSSSYSSRRARFSLAWLPSALRMLGHSQVPTRSAQRCETPAPFPSLGSKDGLAVLLVEVSSCEARGRFRAEHGFCTGNNGLPPTIDVDKFAQVSSLFSFSSSAKLTMSFCTGSHV